MCDRFVTGMHYYVTFTDVVEVISVLQHGISYKALIEFTPKKQNVTAIHIIQ